MKKYRNLSYVENETRNWDFLTTADLRWNLAKYRNLSHVESLTQIWDFWPARICRTWNLAKCRNLSHATKYLLVIYLAKANLNFICSESIWHIESFFNVFGKKLNPIQKKNRGGEYVRSRPGVCFRIGPFRVFKCCNHALSSCPKDFTVWS